MQFRCNRRPPRSTIWPNGAGSAPCNRPTPHTAKYRCTRVVIQPGHIGSSLRVYRRACAPSGWPIQPSCGRRRYSSRLLRPTVAWGRSSATVLPRRRGGPAARERAGRRRRRARTASAARRRSAARCSAGGTRRDRARWATIAHGASGAVAPGRRGCPYGVVRDGAAVRVRRPRPVGASTERRRVFGAVRGGGTAPDRHR